MNHKFLLCLFLLPTATASAMETVSKDIIIYHINPYLNRFTKNELRLISKKYSEWIVPQDTLNAQYKLACAKNIIEDMVELRKQGALHIHEEIYNLFTENEKLLEKKFWHTQKHFCLNTTFAHGIIKNNKSFIVFLLNETKPSHDSMVIINALTNATALKRNDIIEVLELYKKQNVPFNADHYVTMWDLFC